jgi:predicted porin
MNKNIKLAVAGAILATASAANAGIIIPAGDWTLDISGNVNSYMNWTKADGRATIQSAYSLDTGAGTNSSINQGNGLLPNFLSVGGTTRQNDLDVSFVISLQPGTAASTPIGAVGDAGNGGLNNRQSFITFGDKSWGSVKVGKDLGIFASDAILSDMTLLGVGALGAGGNTTLGRIGYGYIYADWKPQFAYTTPNMGGFQATVGVTQAMDASTRLGGVSSNVISSTGGGNAGVGYEAKASYGFDANGVTGKVWVSGIAQKIGSFGAGYTLSDTIAKAADIGANINVAGFGLTGYYYGGRGIGTMGQMLDGIGGPTAARLGHRDSNGGYVQATYVLPTKTKAGISWGVSQLDLANGETSATMSATLLADAGRSTLIKENRMTTVGLYHPLTKHLNLVAEYSHITSENQAGAENKAHSTNLGAILFF